MELDSKVMQQVTDTIISAISVDNWRLVIVDIAIKQGGNIVSNAAYISSDYKSVVIDLSEVLQAIAKIILPLLWPKQKTPKDSFNKCHFIIDGQARKLYYTFRYDEDYSWLQSVNPSNKLYKSLSKKMIKKIESWEGLSPQENRPWI